MKNGFLSILFFWLPVIGTASDSLTLPIIHPSIISAFDIVPQIPASSYANLLTDQKGRLWVNPLPSKGQAPLDFYQFDGYRSYLKPHSDSSYIALGEQTILKGVMENGSLFGYAEKTNQFFFFNPDHSSFQYHSIAQGEEVENLLLDKNGNLFILARSADHFIVYSFLAGKIEVHQKFSLAQNDALIEVLIDHGIIVDGSLYFVETIRELSSRQLISVNLIRLFFDNSKFEKIDITHHFIEKWDRDVTENFFLLSMAADHEDNLLLSFFTFGDLFIFDTDSKQFTAHTKFNQFLFFNNIKAQDIRIFSDQNQNLIIEAFKGFLENENGSLVKKFNYILIDEFGKYYDYNPVMSNVINSSKYHTVEVHDIYGTDFKQHAYLSLRGEFLITNIQQRLGVQRWFEGFPIRGVAQIDEGYCLVNFDNKEATVVDVNTRESFELNNFTNCLYKDGPNLFCQIIRDDDDNTWFPSWDKLLRFDPSKKGCDVFSVGTTFLKFDFLNDKLVILIDDQKGLVYTFDLDKQILHPFPSNDEHLKLEGFVNDCLVSTSGNAWIATDQGVWKVDYLAKKYQKIILRNGSDKERVLCINEDEAERIWLGVFNSGIHVYDPETEEIIVIDDRKGLSNNSVVGILLDDENYKWVSTFDGINILSPKGNVLAYLSEENGLSTNEFNRYSAHKSNNSQLMFGSISGLNILDPDIIKSVILKEDSLLIYPTSLTYFDGELDEEYIQTTSFDFDEKIVLPADQRYLILEFGLTDYSLPTENKYAYKIVKQSNLEINKESDWIEIGANSRLTLNNLQVGDYTIFVRGTDHKGNKTLNQIKVPIRVKEFFYKTWWFYVLCSLPFITFAWLWYRRNSRERERLEEEVKKRTQKIEAQAEELKQLDQMKSRFFTNISHELRSPLTLISTPMQNVLKKFGDTLDEEIIKSIKSVSGNSKKLLNLVDELMDLSRIDAGKLELSEEVVYFHEYCRHLFSAFESNASFKKINYSFDFRLDPNLQLFIDKKRVEKIINNLISNALKFTPENGTITYRVDATDEMIVVQIIDTGRGVSKEDLPHLFQRYFQTLNKDIATEGGTGIGLALAKELALLMKGDLVVASEWGKGSVFTFTFPRKELELVHSISSVESESQYQESKTLNHKKAAVNGEKGKILVVEDNQDMQDLIQSVLGNDYTCVFANDGQIAWNLLESLDKSIDNIDLILSDYMMPNMDGFQLLEKVKNHPDWQQFPVVMLTARAAEKDKLAALRMGVDEYLTKPFSPDELLVRIENLITNFNARKVFKEEMLHKKMVIEFDEEFDSADNNWLKEVENHALDAIEKRLPLTRKYLADQMYISERQLARNLKTLTGLSPKKYILEVKLQKGRFYLENKKFKTVAEVAYSSGFNNPDYFSKVYFNHFGKKPGSYYSS